MSGVSTEGVAAEEDIVEFAKELSEALKSQGLDPRDKKVQDTVAVCAQVFGQLITDMGKTMTDLNDRLKGLVAVKAQRE